MGQVKALLLDIAEDVTSITLDNCQETELPFSFKASNVADLEAEVEGVAWEAYRCLVARSYSDLFDGESLSYEFDFFWEDFWKYNQKNIIESHGFEL